MIAGFVRGQTLRLSVPRIAADTIDYLTAKFLFQSSDWAGLEKWTHWQRGDMVYDIPLVNDQITEDAHLNLDAGEWTVWIHGNRYADGIVAQRITTDKAKITVVPTGTLNGEPFPEMPASVTEQIFARLDVLEQNGTGGGSGTVTSVAGVEPDESGNVPLKPADIGAAEIEVTDEEINLVTVVGKAAVGQTIVVDVVDEDGYPMSWHAVDLPEGIPGEPGTNGITPHIGENNNWYIGDTDTGVTAAGRDGAPGEKGDPGEPGDDYVLTAADKAEIAQEAAGLIDTALLGIIGSGGIE